MKRLLIFLTLVAIATVLSAQTPPAQTAPRGNAENGKKIYTSYGCYQCHNYSAAGGGAGPRLAPKPLAWPGFSAYVRKPAQQMPPYTTKIVTDQELADIYAFLLTIPAPPSLDSILILKPLPPRED